MKKARELWEEVFLHDEFDDAAQNEQAYGGKISGAAELMRLEEWGPLKLPILDAGCGSSVTPDVVPLAAPGFCLEPNPSRAHQAASMRPGWLEDFVDGNRSFVQGIGTIRAWGMFCFLRSVPEALIECNRALMPDGVFILDIVTFSTMPLAQTHNGSCFPKFMSLFGFEIEAVLSFGEEYHQRLGIRARKVREFDPRHLRMPQTGPDGEIKNYLPERDWFLL